MAKARFSGTVKLDTGDLSDYIAPAQNCVVGKEGNKEEKQDHGVHRHVEKEAKPVKVTLHDCLACSGCVTSAETVLLEQQSTEELQAKLNDDTLQVVVTVSLQSVMALATHYGIDAESTLRKIAGALKAMGAKEVYDACFSKDLSLIEIADEFVRRYKERGCLPMLASACPGWICYAEKTLGNFALPYISTTKSPQQIAGTVVKNFVCQRNSLNPGKVYHCTIMPCYDKKLEASREDFVSGEEDFSYCEVDCVITTGELVELFEARGVSIVDTAEGRVDEMTALDQEERHAFFSTPGGSGGFAEHVFKEAASALFGEKVEGPLQMRVLRNQDFREISLESNGEKVLNFATVYGFRNIQNLVRKLKTGKSPYHFVEIMACPGGCVNGGGQLQPKEGQSAKELIAELETLYNASIEYRHPWKNKKVQRLYEEWLTTPQLRKHMLHTGYHARENTIGVQVNNW